MTPDYILNCWHVLGKFRIAKEPSCFWVKYISNTFTNNRILNISKSIEILFTIYVRKIQKLEDSDIVSLSLVCRTGYINQH